MVISNKNTSTVRDKPERFTRLILPALAGIRSELSKPDQIMETTFTCFM